MFTNNYGIAITFARWRFEITFETFRYYFLNHVRKFASDIP